MVATRRWFARLMCLILLVAITGIASGNGVRTLLVEAVRPGLEISIDKGCGATYTTGETLDVTVLSELDGYLTIYDFTTDGLVHQIFPNEYYSDNLIQRGVNYRIPGNLLPFVFRVAAPEGEEVLFAVVTSSPVDFLPQEFFDYSYAFPQIILDDEEAADRLTQSIGIIPNDTRSAVAVCHFQVVEAEEPTPSFDYSVSASPVSGTATRGDSVSTTVRGRRTAGTSTQVSFSITGLPSGVTASVSSWSWNLGDESRTVTFSVGTSASLGSHTITIRGSGVGVTRTTTFVLTIEAPVPLFNFSVSTSPTSGTVTRGDSISTTVRGRRTAGTSTQVSFSIIGLPSGVTASVSSWSWNLGDESRTVTFSVGTSASLGSHTITIRGSGGGATRTTTFLLTVQAQETTPEPKAEGETYGLFIAISDYAGDTDNDFSCPVMQNTIQLIQDTIGSFFDHTKQLDDEEATRSAILATMRSFLGQAGPDDTVYFHFAGHGIQVDDEDGDEADGKDEAIAPYDLKLIIDDEIWEIISNLDARRAILVFESCHSGTAERGLVSSSLYSMPGTRATTAGGTMIDDLDSSTRSANGPAILALQASDASESSWLWCGRYGSSGLTFFAEGLADAFGESSQEADTDGDGWVSFQEAFRLAKVHVQEIVEEAKSAGDLDPGTTQTPVMSDGIGEPVNAVEVE